MSKKEIFITGSTGLIGSALVTYLLNNTNHALHLLIRGKMDEAQNKLKKIIDFYKLEQYENRISIINGDVEKTQFGINKDSYSEINKKVTNIVHCAASINLTSSIEDMRKSVETGTLNILNLCRDLEKLDKLEYISTVGVAGNKFKILYENSLDQTNNSFRNNYEKVKSEAEERLYKEIKNGLPATILRPSMVIGNSTDGKAFREHVFYFICDLLSGKLTHGVLPKINDIRIDIIPVDIVARAIAFSIENNNFSGEIFNLSSGKKNIPSIIELQEKIYKTNLKIGRDMKPPISINSRTFFLLLKIASFFLSKKNKKRIKLLPYLLEYLNFDQEFDNKKFLDNFKIDPDSLHWTNYTEKNISNYFLKNKN